MKKEPHNKMGNILRKQNVESFINKRVTYTTCVSGIQKFHLYVDLGLSIRPIPKQLWWEIMYVARLFKNDDGCGSNLPKVVHFFGGSHTGGATWRVRAT